MLQLEVRCCTSASNFSRASGGGSCRGAQHGKDGKGHCTRQRNEHLIRTQRTGAQHGIREALNPRNDAAGTALTHTEADKNTTENRDTFIIAATSRESPL